MFEELGCLMRLIVIDIQLGSVPYQDVNWIQRLRSFHIIVGQRFRMAARTKMDQRRVTLGHLDLSEKRIGWLLIKATHLTLSSCKDIGWMFEYLVTNIQGLAGLKSLTIEYCEDLGPFRGCGTPHELLPNLEELLLWDCDELECVRLLVVPLGLKFSGLRLIRAVNCRNLKYLIPVEMIPYLINLEEIDISWCAKLEKLFKYDNSSGQIMAADPVLPKLRKLRLHRLPELRSICRENKSWQSLEQLEVFHCNQLKRLPLTTQNAHMIIHSGNRSPDLVEFVTLWSGMS